MVCFRKTLLRFGNEKIWDSDQNFVFPIDKTHHFEDIRWILSEKSFHPGFIFG